MSLLLTASRCGSLAALFYLASPRPVSAQQYYDPIAGPLPRIISPANHAVFFAPVDIPLFAFSIRTNVEFYAGTNDLGRGYNLGLGADDLQPGGFHFDFVIAGHIPQLSHIYYRMWTNVPPGSDALTAVTTDGIDDLDNRTSPPVNITVFSSTNTTGTRVVSIFAADPIAISGTNSWAWPGATNETPAWTNWPPPIWHSFTNWGPRNALFLVQSDGDTSDTFAVTYNISGTASNGIDYNALPGSVTIPAGKSHAWIPIVPIDNGPPYSGPKTVILTLTPATNGPPPLYVLGSPTNAEALILHDWPVSFPFQLPDGTFHVNATGPDGAWFSIQISSDLQNWSSVSTNQVFQGSIDFVDPTAPNNSRQFYRTVPVTNTPTN